MILRAIGPPWEPKTHEADSQWSSLLLDARLHVGLDVLGAFDQLAVDLGCGDDEESARLDRVGGQLPTSSAVTIGCAGARGVAEASPYTVIARGCW